MAEEGAEEVVEDWVVATQSTLGQLIAKPRMLPERLRKPPFRFLFDCAAEVARTTGFGLQELFAGHVAEKPVVPSTRDEKIDFLERWLGLVVTAMGEQTPELANVQVQDVVCGARPEWTNYMLQCLAVAAWPTALTESAEPAPAAVAQEPADFAAQEAAALALAADIAAEVYVAEEPASEALAPVELEPRLPEGFRPVAEFRPLEAGPTMTEEEAKQIAAGMDLRSFMEDMDTTYQEFNGARTTNGWNFKPAGSGGAEGAIGYGTSAAGGAEGAAPAAPGSADEAAARLGTGSLRSAAAKAEKRQESILQATSLLDAIEAGLDDLDSVTLARRERERLLREAQEEARRSQDEAALARAEAVASAAAAAEAAAEEETQRSAEEKAQRKAQKEAAKAAKRAQKEAEEEAAKKTLYPVSRSAVANGARLVSCVGDVPGDSDEEYKWDGYEEEKAPAPPASVAAEKQAPNAAFDMGGLGSCLTDDLLAAGPSAPAVDPLAFFSASPQEAATRLFDKLKSQLKDTFVSFLCASMPESLLRQHDAKEVVQCLQFLLKELRRCAVAQEVEDVINEDPTSVSEALRAAHGQEWLTHLQSGSSWALCSKFDVPELVDTLQSLCQTCYERLTEAIGPISLWADESSPLRYIPPLLPEPPPPLPEADGDFLEARRSVAEGGGAPWSPPSSHSSRLATAPPDRLSTASPELAPRFDSTLGPAAWERGPAAQPPPATAAVHGRPLWQPPPTSHGATWQTPAQAPPGTSHGAPPPPSHVAPPKFDATLGPAPWDMPGGGFAVPGAAAPGRPAPGTAALAPGRPLPLPGTAAAHQLRPATTATMGRSPIYSR